MMFDHATIPGLPERLWQAAFYLDMVRREPDRKFGPEEVAMAPKHERKADEVIAWRKKKLGW